MVDINLLRSQFVTETGIKLIAVTTLPVLVIPPKISLFFAVSSCGATIGTYAPWSLVLGNGS
ncbi:MAG: hypothetical protein ACJAX5_003130 [Patiriisocius sp.]|jgi:hypothetical protein